MKNRKAFKKRQNIFILTVIDIRNRADSTSRKTEIFLSHEILAKYRRVFTKGFLEVPACKTGGTVAKIFDMLKLSCFDVLYV